MAEVALSNIHKSFGQTEVLKGIDLTISHGEFVALLGPSGCGKTTLLRIIAGLEAPDTGSISIGGRDVTGLDPSDRNIALVFQSYALYPHKTVFENIAFPLRMRAPWFARIPVLSRALPQRRRLEQALQTKVRDAAAQVGIGAYLDRKPAQLSGGQRQRVALTRAMVREPAAFLMDEPLSNLDAKLRSGMRIEIKELQRRLDATIIYVTHDQTEAMTMADRVVLLHEGVVQQIGAPMSLYQNPCNRFVAQFIGSPSINMLLLEAAGANQFTVNGAVIETVPADLRQIARSHGGRLWLGVRPEHVALVPEHASGIPGRVALIEPLGHETLIDVSVLGAADIGTGPDRIVVRAAPDAVDTVRAGAAVRLQPDWQQALAFDEQGRRIAIRAAMAAA